MVKPVSDLHQTEDAVWHRIREREPVIRRLAEFARVPDAEMTAAMATLNLGRSQIYKLLARYRSQSVTSALLPRQPGPEAGHSKLDADVEGLIELAIRKQYLSRQKLNVSALCRAIAHECKARCLPPPSRRAVQARVSRQPARLVTARREGAKAATDRFRPVAKTYKVDAALAVVQVDHTPIDQIVVDEHSREPLGRPWLTLIVDVASRMILGFYVTLEDPSATSVAMAIRHAVLPKAAWLAELGIDAPWPAEGIPDCLHMDNAKEFHSRALARGCDEYGIERRYRPPATPHFGGHIERLIGTMMGAVHLLPGTTFSNIQSKGDYDPIAKAVMSLTELERWLALEIAGVYQNSVHRGISRPPSDAWKRALALRSSPPRHPPDPEQFLFDFLPFEYRTIRRDGIRLFNIAYWDPMLSIWIGHHSQMPIKYDPRDLSRVFIQTPDGSHIAIPYADLGRPAITLWEQKRAVKALREEGRAAVDENMIFRVVEAQRSLVAEATNKTLRARRSAVRTGHALAGVRPEEQPPFSDNSMPEDDCHGTEDDRYLPYPLEDWS